MKPDRIDRAHLRDPGDLSHSMHRYPAPAELAGVAQHFWIPVWSVEAGREATQRVLQYPCGLVVVSPGYARFYGVAAGLSSTTLTGDGWAVGVMLEPAGGFLLARRPMIDVRDRHVELAAVLPGADAVAEAVRTLMRQPLRRNAHAGAMAALTAALLPAGPVDAEGELINEVVAFIEGDPQVVRVAQVCQRFELSERSLQRLTRRRVGLSPKWLIQRRRLQEASVRLRARPGSLADVAADLGYADQPHFTRDFRAVTGMTPGEFAARYA